MLKKIVSYFSIVAFLFAASASLSSCGNKKKGYKVRSGTGMGNKKHKNKHVWGK